MRFTLLPFILLYFASASHAAENAPTKEQIAKLVEQARTAWKIPGAAMVMVHDDEVIYLAGHGTRELDGKEEITPDTLFPLASCSKAFTTTLMAMLVGQEKLSWDDRVPKHVPFFRLKDPLADAQVTLRDLVTHRTGVGGHDFLWYHAPWSPEESVRRLAHLKPSFPIRSRFAYQSTMFTAAGLAVGNAGGKAWEEQVRERIFTPLKMKTACCTSTEALKNPDRAMGHYLNDRGELEVIPEWYPVKLPNAAGSISASARDLVNWLRFHVNGGIVDGKRLVEEKHLRETHTPQMVIRQSEHEKKLHPETHLMCYGMAWVLQDYRGVKLISHAGAIEGFKVQITIVPELKLGFAILANVHFTRMNLALAYTVLDSFLKVKKPRDWNSYLQKQVEEKQNADREKLRARLAERQPGTKTSRGIAAFAGKYHHPAYGDSRIVYSRGQLTWRWSNFVCRLEHFHFDTFVATDPVLGRVELQFHLDRKGQIASYDAGFSPEVRFQRKP